MASQFTTRHMLVNTWLVTRKVGINSERGLNWTILHYFSHDLLLTRLNRVRTWTVIQISLIWGLVVGIGALTWVALRGRVRSAAWKFGHIYWDITSFDFIWLATFLWLPSSASNNTSILKILPLIFKNEWIIAKNFFRISSLKPGL